MYFLDSFVTVVLKYCMTCSLCTQITYYRSSTMSNETYVYCGDMSRVPPVLTIYAAHVRLVFKSDGHVTAKGFKLSYYISQRSGKKFDIYMYIAGCLKSCMAYIIHLYCQERHTYAVNKSVTSSYHCCQTCSRSD